MKKEKFETMVFDALEKFFSDAHTYNVEKALKKSKEHKE